MNAWVGVAPLIGAGSLDGFAIGALATGACFLAITAPRRARKRHALALSDGHVLGSRPHDGLRAEWLCEHVMAAEAFPVNGERLAQPDIPDLQHLGQAGTAGTAGQAGQGPGQAFTAGQAGQGPGEAFTAGQAGQGPGEAFTAGQAGQGPGQTFPAAGNGRAAGSHRSRHRRLGDSLPGSASPRRRFSGRASAPRRAAWADDLLPAATSRHAAFPDSALPGGESRGGAHRLPELAFPDDTFGDSKRPEVRRLPRHAAPGISLSGRLSTRMSSLMTSLTATRALIGGVHG